MTQETKNFHGFKFPDPNDPFLAQLRDLTNIQLNPNSEVEKAKIVGGYVHNLFTHDGDNQPSSFDAITIFNEAKQGESFRCLEYSILAAALLLAHGVPARVVGLKTKDVETREYGAGHVVVEFWAKEFDKWVMCDVQWGIIPATDSKPLNAVELGKAIQGDEPVEYEPVADSRFADKSKEYTDWIKEYLYFYDSDIQVLHTNEYKNLKDELKLMLVPEGVKPPEIFQNSFKMNLISTTNPADFYPDMNATIK